MFGFSGKASAATIPTAAWNVTDNGTGHVTELTGAYSAGTIIGSPTFTTGPNGNGSALSFTSGQKVDLGHNFQFGSSDFTVAIWLKTIGASQSVAVGEYNTTGGNVWCGMADASTASCLGTGTGGSALGVNNGSWHLIGLIRRGTSVYMSVDGVDSSPSTILESTVYNPGGNLYINSFGSSGLFSGSFTVYEVGVWSGTGLSSAEMAAKYADPATLWASSSVALASGTISLSSKTSTVMNLSSTAATGGISPYSYQWYRSTNSGFVPGPTNILTGQTSLTLNDTGLIASTSYYYKLRSTDNASAITDSSEFLVTTNAVAMSYTPSGPSSGLVNGVSTNFTITPNGEYAGTITPISTGSGTFSPTSLTWDGSSTAQTFTYTPTSGSGSPHIISVTSSPSITNPASINYTVSIAPTVVYPNNSNLYWSIGTVYVNGTSFASMVVPGAYLKTNFSGTSIALNVDLSAFVSASVATSNYPLVRYQVDGGVWTQTQLTSTTSTISVAGLSSGTHALRFEYVANTESTDNWNTPVNALKITSISLDGGASVLSPTILNKTLRVDGDSITQGVRSYIAQSNPSGNRNYLDYAYLLAESLGTELTQLGYGSQGWLGAGSGGVPSYPNAVDYYYNGVSRLNSGVLANPPAYWLVNQGTNDGGDVTQVTLNRIGQMRAEAGTGCQIFIVVPFNGSHRTQIASAYNSYVSANPLDVNTHLIDLGSISYATTDGLHPNASGYQTLATAIVAAMNVTPPTITNFSIPITSSSLAVSLVTFMATDDTAVTGYCLTESNNSNSCSWNGTVPTEYTFSSEGAKTLCAFVRDAAGNISTSASATATITLTTDADAATTDRTLSKLEIKLDKSFQKVKNQITSLTNSFKLQSSGDSLINGQVKIYQDKKRIKTINVGEDGSWQQKFKFNHDFDGTLQVKYYNQTGNQLDSDKFKLQIDTTKPTFTTPFPTTLQKNQLITFTATDNQKISYYRIKILDETGHILRNRKQHKDTYTIPVTIQSQASTIVVRAYDKAGNYIEQKAQLSSITPSQPSPDYKGSGNTTAEVQGVSDVKEETTNSETSTPVQEEDAMNRVSTPVVTPQPTKTSHWWNPWSWF